MMKIGFCTPDKAQYLVGERVRLTIPGGDGAFLILTNLHDIVDYGSVTYETDGKSFSAIVDNLPKGSYGVSFDRGEERYETAFDVVESRSDITRYGFLTDFTPDDEDIRAVKSMARLHLNAVQFYDWMYRHDDLVANSEKYRDALGKEASRDVIEKKIAACRDMGMRPFAYGAVYAASKEKWEQFPEWGLYTMENKPLLFGNWLYFMNISKDCGWFNHILKEFERSGASLGFMGIHMDTYGFPKHAWDANGCPVELSSCFTPLINAAAQTMKNLNEENGVIFNAVNNWPVTAVSKSAQDAVYIEVWPPYEHYIDLYRLIREARQLSGKPVVLAAYMEPFKNAKSDAEISAAEWSYLYANAAICASGGTQLALGENDCILCDSYYVDHACLRDSFLPLVQRYADFVVRYAPLLYSDDGMDVSMTGAGGINEEFIFSANSAAFSVDAEPDAVWVIIHETVKRISIQLINLVGNNGKWNAPKGAPTIVTGVTLKMRLDRPLKGVYVASPDGKSLAAASLDYNYEPSDQGRVYNIFVGAISIWTIIWVDISDCQD
ncbi:MAG: glycoside hydrolase family 66 protein [Clostridiales bacterium]|jgi:dextranase|nr:glycoside hydrolase family 66 protein [Clostridiales bacterium]